MALKRYECPTCCNIRETLKKSIPYCNHNQEEDGSPFPKILMTEILEAPNQKFMITANKATGTSKIKDSDKMLKSRSRNHSRDVLGDETIQTNLDMGSKESVSRNLLNEKGQKRRKIDDI